MKKKSSLYLLLVFLGSWLIVKPALAVCPICTFAVAGGLGLSRWCGVDDTVTGLWIGGLIVSMIIWMINWFNKKNIRFWGRKIITTVAYFVLILAPLYWKGLIGKNCLQLWGVNRLLLGIAFGSVFFFIGSMLYLYVKKRNNDKAHFPFEKIVFSIAPLIILTIIFYLITKK